MVKHERTGRESAVSSAVGALLSWVAGKDSVTRGACAADGAIGELVSWVTGTGGKKDKRAR
ncbi:MAG: hypothetical protein ACRDPD_29215 [Streptosporangiaceae bacterium]